MSVVRPKQSSMTILSALLTLLVLLPLSVVAQDSESKEIVSVESWDTGATEDSPDVVNDLVNWYPPITLFLEVRNHIEGIPIYSRPEEKSKIGTLPAGSLLKVNLKPDEIAKRKSKHRENKFLWRSFPVKHHQDNTADVRFRQIFIKDDWKTLRSFRTPSDVLPVQGPIVPKHEKDIVAAIGGGQNSNQKTSSRTISYELLESHVVTDKDNSIHLRYKLKPERFNDYDDEDVSTYWVNNAIDYKRYFSYQQSGEFTCIDIVPLMERKEDLKLAAVDLGLLEKRKKLRERLADEIFSGKYNKKTKSRLRNWIKVTETALGTSETDVIIQREELDFSVDIGGRIGYDTFDLSQTGELSEFSYTASAVAVGAFFYLPLFADIEFSVKGELTVPYEERLFDEVKSRLSEDPFAMRATGEQFFYYTVPTNTPNLDWQVGAGFVYKGMIASDLTFGYDALVGMNFASALHWDRFILSLKYQPVADDFNLKLSNKNVEAYLGYRFWDNENSRDWILFGRYSILDVTEDNGSELNTTNILGGISYGF